MEKSQDIVEASKAVREVARTGGKTVDLVGDFGRFISQFVSGSLEQGTGIFEDKLRYMRWERQVRYMERVHQRMNELGERSPTKPIPLKLAVPLFQAASLEDDDYLQDMWANLLVNASVPKRGVELRRAYIDVLERLSPAEALVLEKLCTISEAERQGRPIVTGHLPEAVYIEYIDDEQERDKLVQPSKEITMALANLSRLGCVKLQMTWAGGEVFTLVHPTVIGRGLIEAVQM